MKAFGKDYLSCSRNGDFMNETNMSWRVKNILVWALVCICLPFAGLKTAASGSVYFNGTTNSYMQFSVPFSVDSSIGHGAVGNLVTDYTLEFWFMPDSNADQTIYYTSGYSPDPADGVDAVYSITTSSNGAVNVVNSGREAGAPFNGSSMNSGPNLIIPKQWQHVAMTRQHIPFGTLPDYSVDAIEMMYFNGSLVFSNALRYEFRVAWLASSPPLLCQGYSGVIGEFRNWNRALSQTEIQTKMTQVLNPTNETGLVGYWRFTEGTSNIVHDLAGTNNGTIFGATWDSDLPNTTLQSPAIVQQPMNQTVYNQMSNVMLSVGVTGSQPLLYQWFFNNTNIPGATSSTFTITKVGLTNLGVYSVVITNLAGTATSSNATLTMYPFLASPFAGTTVLWGQDAILSVNPAGTGPFTYQWFKNGMPLAGGTNQTFTIPSIQFTNAGFYSVVVTSAFGSVTNTPAQVVVNPAGVSLGMYPGITVTGTVGYVYSIQSTPSLSNTNGWITLTNLTLQQSPELWLDSSVNASSHANPKYFYRVVPPQ